MHSENRDQRHKLTSCSDGSPTSAPVSSEYERAMLEVRIGQLEEENRTLLERVVAIESKSRNSSRPPEFEVSNQTWKIRGSQLVGVAMAIAAASVGIAYLMLRK